MAIRAPYPFLHHRSIQDGGTPLGGDDFNYGGGGGGEGGSGTFVDHTNTFHNQQPQQYLSPGLLNYSSPFVSQFSYDSVSQIIQQNNEIDHFLTAQEEQMRRMLLEKMQRLYQTLLNAVEEVAERRLREKEADLISKMNQIVLEARARMQENYAVALQLQVQQEIMAGGGGGGGGQGGDHDQDVNGDGGGNSMVGGEAEDAGSACFDTDWVVPSGLSCKSCGKRAPLVVLLPCRHLCLCAECDAVAQACPTCFAVRSSSLEVLFS